MDKSGHKEKDTDRPIYFYREGDIKIIYRERENAWEMYDLQSDLGEKHNIAGSSPILGEMQSKLLAVRKSNRSV